MLLQLYQFRQDGKADAGEPEKQVNIRNIIKAQLYGLVDARAVSALTLEDLTEQVIFVVGELVRRNRFVMKDAEVRDLSRILASDLSRTCRTGVTLH